ncbi:hypothetical protein JCM19045_592 [Bacillus sp. JCM 19045]|nr:hypothetical protein JCM19045_592 [Bacillus sp. JCM 19045]
MVSWLKDDERQQPLTDEQRIAVEKQLKIQLPEELIALFKQQNGGYIEGLACPTAEPTSWADDHIQIDHFFEISEESGLVDSPYLCSEWGLRKKLVIFSGDGYGWFALDYKRKKNGPRVVYIDSELEEEQELAPSFAAFLSKLVPAEEYVIEKEDEA